MRGIGYRHRYVWGFLRKRRGREDRAGAPEAADAGVPNGDSARNGHSRRLVKRLRELEWPAAPDDVRERVLERVLTESEKDSQAGRRAD